MHDYVFFFNYQFKFIAENRILRVRFLSGLSPREIFAVCECLILPLVCYELYFVVYAALANDTIYFRYSTPYIH